MTLGEKPKKKKKLIIIIKGRKTLNNTITACITQNNTNYFYIAYNMT